MRGLPFTVLLPLFALLLVLQGNPLNADEQRPEAFHQWQVLEVKTGRAVAFEDWMVRLATQEVIYLGEEHRNASHVEAALQIMRALLKRDRQPVLALEMFGWDGQDGLDRYLSDRGTAREVFLQESHWEKNWGGRYEDYEPLVNFAQEWHIHVLALNPPKALVRRVARDGLAGALADPEMSRWEMREGALSDEPAYRKVILEQLRRCHDGLSDEAYQRMYEASNFRDEGMAKTISEYLRRVQNGLAPQGGPIVSYTGGGHIQYHLPIPNRVLRRHAGPIRQTTVYLTAYEPARSEEIRELIRDSIADYVWLTPLGADGAPRRCR